MCNLLHKNLNQIIINNIPIIIDIFHSEKYNALIFIINNPKYIFEKTNVNIKQNIQITMNQSHYELTYFDPTDFDHIEQLNGKHFFAPTGFHMEVGIIKYVYPSLQPTIVEVKLNDQIFVFDIYEPDTTFLSNKCLTTIHKDQHQLIPQWIDYHKKIGFEKFIIYDNDWNESENRILKTKYYNDIIIINANWPYWIYGESIGQVIQQNHALWKYSPKFLGLTDLDEYINIDPNLLFNQENSVISIPNTFFGCGRNVEYTSSNFIEKLLYREQQTNITSRRKCIIQSDKVDLFCVHIPITFDKNIKYLNFNEGYLNHYRQLSCNRDHGCNCNDRCAIYDASILTKL
jgi:hypothetical protein